MRRVRVFLNNDPWDVRKERKYRHGKFHSFMNDTIYDHSGTPHIHAIAIIELEDGQVVTIHPDNVQFVE